MLSALREIKLKVITYVWVLLYYLNYIFTRLTLRDELDDTVNKLVYM